MVTEQTNNQGGKERGRSERRDKVRRQLIQATVRLIAREGVTGITHRAVAAESATSHGLATYHFGSIAALIRATMEFVGEANEADQRTYFPKLDRAADGEALATLLAGNAARRLVGNRRMGLALMELRLAAARDPALRPAVRRWGASYTRRVEQNLARLGARHAERDARELTSLISGLVVDQLSLPRPHFLRTVLEPAVRERVRASLAAV